MCVCASSVTWARDAQSTVLWEDKRAVASLHDLGQVREVCNVPGSAVVQASNSKPVCSSLYFYILVGSRYIDNTNTR